MVNKIKRILKIHHFLLYILFFSAVEVIALKYPLCISLGSACGPALNLRGLGIRTEAYPFDWMVSPLESLYKALEDDFKYFLTNLKMRPDNHGVIDYYGFNFTHDWPTIAQPTIDALNSDFIGNNILFKEWEKALPSVRQKYVRRIERFRNACLGKEKVFFLRSEGINKESAIQLRNFLKNKYPTLDFVLIALAHNESFRNPWNIDGVKNFYIFHWDDAKGWGEILKQVDPAFKHVTVQRGVLHYQVCNCCLKYMDTIG